jgi:hypothetical protein
MVGRTIPFLLGAVALLGLSRTLAAQDHRLPLRLDADPPTYRARSEEHLARELVDPLSGLASLDFQNDLDGDVGRDQAGLRYTLTIRPNVPLDIAEDWLLITRTEIPIIYQKEVMGDGSGSDFGLGDILQTFLLSPKGSDGLKYGIGPAWLWPTATRDVLGREKWAVGPAAAISVESDGLTIGVLTHHLWSFAGRTPRDDVNQTFIQPFAALTFSKGTTVFVEVEADYDWHDDRWTLPVIAGVQQVMKFSDQAVSLGVDGKYWVEGPSTSPDWGIRVVLTFIFPR